MTLTMYQSDNGRTMYKLDGQRISVEKAEEIVLGNADIEIVDETECASYGEWATLLSGILPAAVNVERNVFYRTVSDSLTAIKEIERFLPEFVIDHTVKLEEGVFAKNENGDTLKLYDNYLELTIKSNSSITIYNFDIAESRFIAELEKIGDAETFEITGDSGSVYTFGKDYELLPQKVAETVETDESLSGYISNRRKTAQKARAA